MVVAAVPTTAVHPLVAEPADAFPLDRDERWFNEVYTTCIDPAYRYAGMIARDHQLADEIIADAFFRVWRSRHTYRATGPVLAWVLSITRNCARDAIRRRREVVALTTLEENDVSGPPLELPMFDHADAAAIKEALSQLTEEQQQVIFLRFYEELPHEKVAARLGRTPNAVRAIQFRALARLRKLLEGIRDVDDC